MIVNYDPRWVIAFEEEKQRILSVVGYKIIGIEHIGSTAVVSLGSKPVIDIMVGISGPSEAFELLSSLTNIGYTDVISQLNDSEWYYCLCEVVKGKEDWLQNFHLHLMKYDSETWKRHILFRDFLRNNVEIAKKYEQLKRILAEKYGCDREAYTSAKTEFIESVLKQTNKN